MTKIYKFLLLVLLSFSPFIGSADTANISKLVFTTEDIIVAPGEISKAITVQTQNSGETAEPVSETNDVTFTSTSATGEFLNSTGNAASKTMNKNSSSRTFYYRDSTEGNYTLTVLIKGRESGKSFTASMSIVVGIDTSGTDEEEDDNHGSSGENSNQQPSAHSSSQPLSNIGEIFNFKVDAGRQRLWSINSPVVFNARVSKLPKNANTSKYTWSFGDGISKKGREVSHMYSYPGEYIVMLNARNGQNKAVSRTTINVVEPKISIINVHLGPEGYIEINNETSDEINIQGWKMSTGMEEFVFSEDTIIKPNSHIKFPLYFLNKNTKNLILSYPNGRLITDFKFTESGTLVPTS